jgi:hypothetical protein
MKGTLTIVGTGIKLVAHTTPETRAAIEAAAKVYFLASDPAAAQWITTLNPSAESLNVFLEPGGVRAAAYAAMAEHILAALMRGSDVCAVFYGHPGVLVQPAREILRRARALNLDVMMLPAVSSEDCLFADLGIDPGDGGFQSFEATDFLVCGRQPDVTCQLLLWQIGVIGQPLHLRDGAGNTASPKALRMLQERLAEFYGPAHEVVLYQAPLYVICLPRLHRLPLAELSDSPIPHYASLFVPRLHKASRKPEIVRELV